MIQFSKEFEYSAYPELKNSNAEYRINEQGFRGKDFDLDNTSVIALGCSITFGVGVEEHEAWPSIVEEQLGQKVANISMSAASADTCFRFASYWIPKLKPSMLVYCEPPPYRFELLKSKRSKMYTMHEPDLKTDMQAYTMINAWTKNPINFDLNYAKNSLAIQKLCEDNNCKFYKYVAIDCFTEDSDLGSDYMHPGAKQHSKFADMVLKDIT